MSKRGVCFCSAVELSAELMAGVGIKRAFILLLLLSAGVVFHERDLKWYLLCVVD